MNVLGLLVACLLVHMTYSFCDTIEEAQKNAFKEPAKLTLSNTFGYEIVDGQYTFDFGKTDLLDQTQQNEDRKQNASFSQVLPGIKHIFPLKNNTKHPITISSIQADCMCINAYVIEKGQPKNLPYLVKPDTIVDIKVGFDYYSVYPGKAAGKINVMSPNSKAPLAILVMKGDVESGIQLSTEKVDFMDVAFGTSRSQDFVLTMDKRIPQYLIPSPIEFTSTNPYLKITSNPSEYSIMGVNVKGNAVTFPKGVATLAKDLKLNFRVELADDAPIGKFNNPILFKMSRFPLFALFQGRQLSVQGEIIGNLRAEPLNVLVLSRTTDGLMQKSTNIICSDPIKLGAVSAQVTSANFSVKLVDTADRKNQSYSSANLKESKDQRNDHALQREHELDLKEGEKAKRLEVTLNSGLPHGTYSGKVIISNSINKQRLEIPVFATVTP